VPHLKADPAETTNLAEKPEYEVEVRDLLALTASELKQFGDTASLTSEAPLSAEWTPPQKKPE
jgi:hypothetical protein